MSFTERETAIIHNNTVISDGRKAFGEFDSQVPNITNTELLPVTNQTSETAIIVPVMEREEKIKIFFDRLTQAIVASDVPTSLVVMDNSLTDKFLSEFHARAESLKDSPLVNIIYHHDARMTQTTLRNYAVGQLLPTEVKTVGMWDSDIYCSSKTLRELREVWGHLPELDGVAPPLVGYKSGDIDQIISQYEKIRTEADIRLRTHMPGAIGEGNGVWSGDVLRTTMMRGAFLVNRDFLEKIAKENPNGTPWLEDFVVWQNVPFFLGAREVGLDFGYAMTGGSVVAHDDNVDELSVGYSLAYRRSETLKSLVMLMHRNEVYSEQGRHINSNFLKFNLDAISRVCSFTQDESVEMQESLLQVSEVISKSATGLDFVEKWRSLKPNIASKYVDFIEDVIEKISDEKIYQRVKAIHSSEPSHPMYSI